MVAILGLPMGNLVAFEMRVALGKEI